MKPLIFITAITGLLVFTLGCLKDEISKEQNTQVVQSKKYFSIDDFNSIEFGGFRDGGQNAFQFATSQVEYDPFKPGYPQTVINIQRLDSVKYFRISEPNAGAYEVTVSGSFESDAGSSNYTIGLRKDNGGTDTQVAIGQYLISPIGTVPFSFTIIKSFNANDRVYTYIQSSADTTDDTMRYLRMTVKRIY